MARRVRWARTAAADLEEIAEYIATDAPETARRFVRRLLEAAGSLGHSSERDRRVPELEVIELREIFLDSYRIIYRVDLEAVVIVAIVHGARDLTALWERREEAADSGI